MTAAAHGAAGHLRRVGRLEGPSVDRLIALDGVRTEVAMLRNADGQCRVELCGFLAPPAIAGDANAPVDRLGMGRIMIAVGDIDDVLARPPARGATFIGEVTQYENAYRLCYIRGPEGIIIALAQAL
jgi:catechol 2,3-dioxygenase-like lactoylglutathione lyase family enzyme